MRFSVELIGDGNPGESNDSLKPVVGGRKRMGRGLKAVQGVFQDRESLGFGVLLVEVW